MKKQIRNIFLDHCGAGKHAALDFAKKHGLKVFSGTGYKILCDDLTEEFRFVYLVQKNPPQPGTESRVKNFRWRPFDFVER